MNNIINVAAINALTGTANKDLTGITPEQFQGVLADAMASATTFKAQGNQIISGAVVLFWAHSKTVKYLNEAMNYAAAYKGVSTIKVSQFLTYFTGAKFDKDIGKFVSGGKMKGQRKAKRSTEFLALSHWGDWAHAKEVQEQDALYNAGKHRDRLVKKLTDELELATSEVQHLSDLLTDVKINADLDEGDRAVKVAELTAAMVGAETYRVQCETAAHAFH